MMGSADSSRTHHALGRRSVLLATSALAAPGIAHGQTGLPDRALRIVVGFPNGGGSDLVARAIAPALELRTGRRISVENRPGNTGAFAGEFIKNGAADGTTVALLPTTTLSSKFLAPAWPFDPLTDFAPVMSIGTFQTAIAVSPKIPATTLSEYVAWIKEGEPARKRLGLPATDAILEVYGRMVGRAFGVTLEGVPFRGAAPMVADLQDGKIPCAYGGVTSFIAAYRGGRVRMLAISGPPRLSVIKEVPTIDDVGYPGALMVEWYGVFAKAGTPDALIEAWNKELAAALADREVIAQLEQLGVNVDPSTPQQCSEKLTRHLARWREILQSLGIKPTN
jgi:tripartite-type tricarboxylate transporter receptor subunit TctC